MKESELRAMIREVLGELLKARRPLQAAIAPVVEPVQIASDADLAAFVARLIGRLDDPASGAALRAGHHRFTLARPVPAAGPVSADAPVAAGSANMVLAGTVTEARIAKLEPGTRVMLAPGAVMTPLARDKARARGVVIERRR
ncbi:hypothetical protein EDC22_105279 [Tepidamorphus gemmatus]|uniref:Uncharacterized protein n=1 Tax=Tepidamorphus gemmatus TaxID=747076 RepID=A0A4V6NZQ1_9HYPH|nr:hypothetical protein [Tepidamorphus gemmatus]TCT10778.1 hypothetical protein EDC22_105279 [Tepidamorphus gemmatus]